MTMKAKITFISAGAGSGKTHRLTEILHSELTDKTVRPSGVIATTFTKKAAAELRERVREHLLGHGEFALANAMGHARIGTVNSVCGQLIERFAFESGIATTQQVLEEVQSSVLLDKAIDTVLDGPAMSAFLTVVRRLGLNDDWKEDLQSLVNKIRSNDVPLDRVATFAQTNADELLSHFPKLTEDDLNEKLTQAITTALPEIERVAVTGGKKNTNNYLLFLRGFQRNLRGGNAPWGEWVKLSKEAPEASLRPLVEPIAALAARVAEHSGLQADIRCYLDLMFDLAGKSLQIYATTKRELGALDFTDQEHLLLKLLDHPSVAGVLGGELDLLMVDEFQDTSPIQLALFLKLAQFAKAVYWVGDIKQAIYGFRGSDTELMQAILQELPALGGTKDVLPASWRSRSELVTLVNAVFCHAFENTLPSDEVKLKPTRSDRLPGVPLANWILGGKNVDQEATALATGIIKLVESNYQVIDKGATASRNVRFGDIAILSKTHGGVKRIAAALSTQAVPSATARPGLLQTPEVTFALACLRRLNDPGDTIATAEIVSLGDCLEPEVWVADRLRFLQAGGNADYWLEIHSGCQAAHPLVARLALIRDGLSLLAPKEAMQTVIAECNLAATIVKWDSDPERTRVRLANLETLLDFASQYEDLCRSGQHAASISGLILWLGELEDTEKDMLAEPAIDAVKVMTHHAAKGLEWPVVVLTDLADTIKDRLWSVSVRSEASFDVQNPLKDRFIRYWPWPFGAQKRFSVADAIALTPMADEFRKLEIEESKRLLYVSMTRARDLMILVRSSRKLTGEWLECVDCPWLLPKEGEDDLILPGGEILKADRWTLDPVDESSLCESGEETPLRWFPADVGALPRLPLNFNPSSAERKTSLVVEKCRVGERIVVRDGTDMTILGTAIHACLALSFTDPERLLDVEEVERLLNGFGVAECISARAVFTQTKSLHDWIHERWPSATALAEYPVQSILESGQTLNGRLDLLLDTDTGWVLIDHKSTQLAADHWDPLAEEYGAQLGAYAQAIERASNRSVNEVWLYLPVAAGALRLQT